MNRRIVDTNILIWVFFPQFDNSTKSITYDDFLNENPQIPDFIFLEFINTFHKVFFKNAHKVNKETISSLEFTEENFAYLQRLSSKWWKMYLSNGLFQKGMSILNPVLTLMISRDMISERMKVIVEFAISNKIWEYHNETADWLLVSESKRFEKEILTDEKKILKDIFG